MQSALPQRTAFSAETPVERQLRELRALHALAEAINRSAAVESVYPEALQALRWISGADRAALLLFDAGGSMRFTAWDGLSERYRRAVEGHSPWAANEEQAQPIQVARPEQEPSVASLLPELREEGSRRPGPCSTGASNWWRRHSMGAVI